MGNITLTQEQLEAVIKKAFKDGENWGCTYQSWFTPDEEDHIKILGKTTTEINMMLNTEL